MKDVYKVAGISKQAAHQYRSRSLQRATIAYQFFEQADKIRKDHPGAGCRTMAKDLRCKGWGRDKIEQLLLSNGYRLHYPVNYVRTTYSQTDVYYPNLIEGLELTEINRVVQTDITYYRAGEKFYYVVFLIDVYSRRIVGYAVNKNLEAEGNIKALKMLLKTRKGDDLSKLIHHSDRGSQYIDQEYRQLLKDNGITLSMCKAAWENAYTERINRTIKEGYLDRWVIKDYKSLSRSVTKAVKHYNNKRTHKNIGDKSPVQFEKEVKNLPKEQRPKEKIYKPLERYPQNECE
jgi:transposase InsO family protein